MKNRVREVQFDYLEFLFKGMFSVKSKNYPNSTFFKKDDKVILELEKSGTLWVLYSVWSNISDMFSYGYEETQQLIKEWVEAQLKLRGFAPHEKVLCTWGKVEAQLKQEEVTPKASWLVMKQQVEEQLKQEVVTPKLKRQPLWYKVESQLKNEEITPRAQHACSFQLVESQLKNEEVTPKEAIAPPYSWRNLKQEEVTPRNAIAPPFRWRKLDSEEVTQ